MKKISLLVLVTITLFSLYSCGDSTQNETENGAGAKQAVVSGKDIYMRNCASCHLGNGEGIPNTYPPLAKSDYLTDKERAIGQVIKGRTGEIVVNGKKYNGIMPPQQLNDDEIASVLSFVYSNFGNAGNAITADEVKGVRAKL
ncbi:MAG: cytochrome c [Bacteroidetes bacterium]|nr:cytochrome c [Bacteroidota bacterium]